MKQNTLKQNLGVITKILSSRLVLEDCLKIVKPILKPLQGECELRQDEYETLLQTSPFFTGGGGEILPKVQNGKRDKMNITHLEHTRNL